MAHNCFARFIVERGKRSRSPSARTRLYTPPRSRKLSVFTADDPPLTDLHDAGRYVARRMKKDHLHGWSCMPAAFRFWRAGKPWMACPACKRSRDCVARQVPVGTSSTPKHLCRVQRSEYRQIRVRSRELVRNAGQTHEPGTPTVATGGQTKESIAPSETPDQHPWVAPFGRSATPTIRRNRSRMRATAHDALCGIESNSDSGPTSTDSEIRGP